MEGVFLWVSGGHFHHVTQLTETRPFLPGNRNRIGVPHAIPHIYFPFKNKSMAVFLSGCD